MSEATLTETPTPDDDGVVETADHGTHIEYTDDHGHPETTTGLSNNKLAMWLFLGSECLLFGGLISTYMIYLAHPPASIGCAR